ncbi:MAG: serine hydrolase [Chloroflexi bacterium]|nr:MAG: serine hydrolase [Chloroflexota bacterium]
MTQSNRRDITGSPAEPVGGILAELGGRYAVSAHRYPDMSDDNGADRQIVLYPDLVFPAASLAKLCIAVELFRRVDLGQFDLSERFDTADEPRVGGGGMLDYLDPTTRLTLHELCFLMIAASDNTAANFLLDLVGMGEVNETMRRLNLAGTRLERHFMDFSLRARGHDNVTCAKDIAGLLAMAHGNSFPGARNFRELLAGQQVADDLRAWLPESAELGHKTGALDDNGAGAGTFHDAGLLRGPAGSCVFCLLTDAQPDLPAARSAVGRVLRVLWESWCA